MSIQIKGMKMPENCFTDDCPCLNRESGYCQADKERRYVDGDRPFWCPLAPVPPHGRLIDADALDKQIYNEIPLKVFGNIARMAEMRSIVYHAPTIIEADPPEEE